MNILYIPTFNKNTEIDNFFINKDYPLNETEPDIIYVSGGDGSLLHAIQDYKHLNKPFFGIAAGTKNFLMNRVDLKTLTNLTLNDIVMLKSTVLSVEVVRLRSNKTKKIVFKSNFSNDLVLGGSIMDFNTFNINGKIVKGLGLLINTPLGSTAFNLNNEGEIIEDLCSDKVGFSTIVSDIEDKFNEIINIENIPSIKIESKRNDCSLFIDGTTKIFKLQENDEIIIKKNRHIDIGFLDIHEFKNKRLHQ